MSRLSGFLTLLLLVLFLGTSACSRQEEHRPAPPPAVTKKPQRVIVPEAVKGKWKAVKVAVLDKETKTEEVYTVSIGSSFAIGGGKLQVKVENFLPAFTMDGTTMTSASTATKNPAAQIVIRDGAKELYRGWLFSLYPSTHAYQHPRYSFTLVDFVPVQGKKG